MKLREIVARNLRQLRQAKGLSQEELAHRAGLDRNYIGNLERMQNSPTIDTLERIAAELDCDPATFLSKPG